MALTKEQKKKAIDGLKEKLKKQKAIFFVGINGLKNKELLDLRKKLKKEDSQIVVAKKSLANVAAKEEKFDFDFEQLNGEAAIVFGYKDEIAPAKVIYQFSKLSQKLSLISGFLNGKGLSKEDLVNLASLPSRQELLSKLAFCLKSPVSGFNNVLKANLNNLVLVLSQAKKSN
jgi:large subunit ribosomal protein L10